MVSKGKRVRLDSARDLVRLSKGLVSQSRSFCTVGIIYA
jgi:hypothetical protein